MFIQIQLERKYDVNKEGKSKNIITWEDFWTLRKQSYMNINVRQVRNHNLVSSISFFENGKNQIECAMTSYKMCTEDGRIV